MKKLIVLFISLVAVGAIFHSCDNSKTYAEMLEEERDGVEDFINKYNIQVISESEFLVDTVTKCEENGFPGYNQYVSFSNGVYMQIVKRFGCPRASYVPYPNFESALPFENDNLILVRFTEKDILTDSATIVSNYENPYPYYSFMNIYPYGFRYTVEGTTIYGQFVQETGLLSYYYYEQSMSNQYGTSVPAGWLMALQFVRDGAHVKLIVPSKSGHSIAQKYVYPYFYDIRSLNID